MWIIKGGKKVYMCPECESHEHFIFHQDENDFLILICYVCKTQKTLDSIVEWE